MSVGSVKQLFRRPQMERRTAMITLALVAIFTAALFMRIYPIKYGFYLNEFDPYWNYRAAQYIVDKVDEKGLQGLSDYFTWRDTETWYPEGRDVASTSQVGLHLTGAFLYLLTRNLLGSTISLYDFLVLLPVFVGALTTIVVFLLLRRIAGTTAGLFAALVFAFSTPIIMRGNLGWYKSEPLALLFTIFASYIFLTIYEAGITSRGLILRSLLAGLLLGFGNTSWGGAQYFSIVFGLLFIICAFIDPNLKRTVLAGSILVSSDLFVSAVLPRPGPSIVASGSGAILFGGIGFCIIAYLVKRAREPRDYVKTLIKTLFIIVLVGLVILSLGLISGVSGRYLTAIYPFQRAANPLVESVAEHFVPTGSNYFVSFVTLLFLSGFGAIVAFRRKSIPYAYALIFGLTAIYIASSFSRLMVYASIAFTILASIGFVELTSTILKPTVAAISKKKLRIYEARTEMKVLYSVFMISVLALPVAYPPQSSWVSAVDSPVSLANSAVAYKVQLNDWLEALTWIRENTPEDAVFASWWDYGYWITVMGDRNSLADNATINQTRIAQLGRMFMSNETEALEILNKLKADYVVVFIAGRKFQDPNSGQVLYILGAGGDESKKQWFIKISGLNASDYMYDDEFTPTPYFWNGTILGKMMSFTLYQYVDLRQGRLVGTEYPEGGRGAGYDALYIYREKYSREGDDPLKLVFASSSLAKPLSDTGAEIFASILIYKVVK